MEKILFITTYFIYVILRSKKSYHMLQQNFYNNSNRYVNWINNNKNKSIYLLDWLFIILLLIPLNIYIILTIFYIIMSIYYYKVLKSEQVKIKLSITSRIKRMITTELIIYTILIIQLYKLDNIYIIILLGSLASLNNILIYIVNIINKPIEKIVYKYYYNKAKTKIKEMNRMNVIGITGSYGKTSSKNILADILKVKYDTMPTPKNYNTPYGLMLTINNKLDKFTEYFIAEMGACETGQIKELCDFVNPKYGIITRIGVQHLESFKTEENIQKTKFELIESLPIDGIGILNMDDPKQTSYKIKNKCKIKWISINNEKADAYAKNIEYTYKGMKFDIVTKKETINLETRLLGEANVYNILASVLLALELGLNEKEIKQGVKNIKTIEHRLEIKKRGNITIIDDAYNSNPIGAKMAIDTLALMPGTKVVVTPGMIELKEKQDTLNYELGAHISEVADIVILVGKMQTEPLQKALKDKKFDEKKLYVIDDVKEAFTIVNKYIEPEKELYMLLENDLPDIFNE